MGPLTEGEVEHVISSVPLKAETTLEWSLRGGWWRAGTAIAGQGFHGTLRLDISISSRLLGHYSMQLHQPGSTILRRLDIRGSHRNPLQSGSRERWVRRTHKHRWSDTFAESLAYTPTDIPDTSSPAHLPEPGEHAAVFAAFCAECGVDPADVWIEPQLRDTRAAE